MNKFNNYTGLGSFTDNNENGDNLVAQFRFFKDYFLIFPIVLLDNAS